jgi:hypothetical protein
VEERQIRGNLNRAVIVIGKRGFPTNQEHSGGAPFCAGEDKNASFTWLFA